MEGAPSSGRKRRLEKHLYFDAEEWMRVEARMRSLGHTNFSAFTRTLVLGRPIPTRPDRGAQAEALLRELNRLGVNLNQIARNVNSAHVASFEQVEAARKLMEQSRTLIERFTSGGGRGGDETDPDQDDAG